jgi:hypothetical protein
MKQQIEELIALAKVAELFVETRFSDVWQDYRANTNPAALLPILELALKGLEHSVSGDASGSAEAAAPSVYVASRASLAARPEMWKAFRASGWNITSTWIDEAGEGETSDFTELWARITREIRAAAGVILYAERADFPLKGALVECGIAIGMGKPVYVVLPDVNLEGRTLKPIGSWVKHGLVKRAVTCEQAYAAIKGTSHDR